LNPLIYLAFPKSFYRKIHSTNFVKRFNKDIKRRTKVVGAFPNENSLLKLLYLGIKNASKKCTMPVRNWSLTISQLAIFFEGRLDKYLEV